jgi:hypothetical protein
MAFIKTMTIDGFYSKEEAKTIYSVISPLSGFVEKEFGKELENFNMVAENADELFSKTLNKNVTVDINNSGVFRYPELFIHFEGFDSLNDWLFAVAIEDNCAFNIFEHHSGAKSAIDGYNFNYRNLFEWDLTVNYLLQPGQGIFFRPWLFHSFDQGLIQIFRLKENVN